MTDQTQRTAALTQAQERLRQERETFDRRKEKDAKSFRLRMTMGWIACALLPLLAVGAGAVLYFHKDFPDVAVNVSASTLLVEALACITGVWRAFAGGAPEVLQPVTAASNQEDAK
ncbi:hypothetical protein RKE38_16340 [Phycicoccus sp. M110.8]|uniref:hypothetical protein n=1 Tax=Phycicoccus sp. M110.8 TaxID=3075433 RepID=UPI0028FD7443|nr:hypothetical protein [Phycicoccus sp. M110.8]MDU0315270.1 hypothetical protein [Phycicoccus sp. M110.8]